MKKKYNPILTLTLGWLGIHRYAAGEIGMGLLYTFTGGLLGVGWIIDVVKAFSGSDSFSGAGALIPVSDPASIWSRWDYVNDEYANDRKGRGVGERLTVKSINKVACSGQYIRHDGSYIYHTSLKKCTCPDFKARRVPCKHMYHLAYNIGLNIHLDYQAMLKRALNRPAENEKEWYFQDFYAYRKTFEVMLADKIMSLIREDGGIMTQVNLKRRLSSDELNFYDYTIEMLIEQKRIRKENESNRVVFYVTDFN